VLARVRPDVADADAAIRAGVVWVDGRQIRNPASLVRADARIVVATPQPLRGETKLRAALAAFAPPVAGRVALDVGAAAGGFTRVLLEAGARRVYAVDAGYGQLLGSLRQDPRVVNLERTNLGALHRGLVPDAIAIVTVDISYLALADALPQLAGLELASDAHLIALIKPMFELGLAAPPPPDNRDQRLSEATRRAADGAEAAGWRVLGVMASPVPGARGARELLLHGVRR
jgi:23S rRNA (cytidine1920-2'-O)/16S rRNA (cytidine1409-2'-O)-methyltransferase